MLPITGNPYLRLRRITPLGGYKLELEYTDDLVAVLDFTGELWGEMAKPLLDPAFFARVTVENGYRIVWPNDYDLCPDVVRYWAEEGRITTQEETDAHFAKLLAREPQLA